MNELYNTVTSNGTYNNIPTSITSNTSVVNIGDGITLTKEADKQNWTTGFLTYTITLNNTSNINYVNPLITDIIDNTLVEFASNSVIINGTSATSSEYSYDTDNHTLRFTLTEIAAGTKITITFRVKKKYNKEFYLRGSCSVFINNRIINSNIVSVRSYLVIPNVMSFDCSSPFWRC